MTNWEYKLEVDSQKDVEIGAPDTEETLNSLGAEGWELVSAVEITVKAGGHNLVFFFKRPTD